MTREVLEDYLPGMVLYHQKVVTAMIGHIETTASNLRTRYLAASLLCKDAQNAQIAARHLESHLVQTPENQLNPWEKAFLADRDKMNQLGKFAKHMPPVVLWRGHREFKQLFIFIATRFASCPDHVLDCESIHAAWKWIEAVKRNLSFKMLNAILKLHNYMSTNGGLPDYSELEPYMVDVRDGLYRQGVALQRDPSVAPGSTWQALYASRFNLRASDMELARQLDPNETANPDNTALTAFSNYLRFLFENDIFYALDQVDPSVFFLVIRAKAAPGRNPVLGQGARGRKLAVAWFRKLEDTDNGIQVTPMGGDTGKLSVQLHTIAELAKTIGHYPATDHLHAEAEVEALYEEQFLGLEPVRYDSTLMGGVDNPWNFMLSNPVDLETYTFNERSVDELTKMALVRKLQITENSSDDLRNRRFDLNKDVLLAQLLHGPADPVVAPARGRGRGARGRGKAKARGRGRGP